MRTDPRKACANEDERLWWALVHDGIAHPIMAITLFSRWAVRFHDWTSRRAWPRRPKVRQHLLFVTNDEDTCAGFQRALHLRGEAFFVQTAVPQPGAVQYEIFRLEF